MSFYKKMQKKEVTPRRVTNLCVRKAVPLHRISKTTAKTGWRQP